jgi:hypothetical protein
MRINKTIKIWLGFLSAWVVIAPFLGVAAWFVFMFSIIGLSESQVAPENLLIPAVFLPFFLLMMCTSFLQMGLSAFYLTHIILNKTGNDVLRVVLGILVFFFPYIAMPIYFFVYLWPEKPPQWALAVNPEQRMPSDPS